MSKDGYLPPGTEHSHPYFHEPEPDELCRHCGETLSGNGECTDPECEGYGVEVVDDDPYQTMLDEKYGSDPDY